MEHESNRIILNNMYPKLHRRSVVDDRCCSGNIPVNGRRKKNMTAFEKPDDGNPSVKSLARTYMLIVSIAIIFSIFTVESGNDSHLSVSQPVLTSQHGFMYHAQTSIELFSKPDFKTQVRNLINDENDVIITNISESSTAEKYTFEEDHAPLFPLTREDFVGFLCAIIGLMIAAGGGIGGGGILVPIYILVMRFSPKHAIPLSNITVFGGSIANTLLNSKKRHPLADRPLVDWDLILVMEPLTIAGALLGAFLNKILPEELLTILLVVLLSFTAYNTLKKAVKMYKLETAAQNVRVGANGLKESELTMMASKEISEEEMNEEGTLLNNMQLQEGENPGSDESSGGDDENGRSGVKGVVFSGVHLDGKTQQLLDIMEEEKRIPKGNVTLLVVMFLVVLFINLMKGGGAFSSPLGIKCGSTSFWVANGSMIIWILLISCMARKYLLNRHKAKEECSYKYVDGDIQWDGRATIVYPVICCFAGFFAGMFGVGGGIVKGPLLLAMGVHPMVSSASSACMILFTSFTATTSFVVFGLLIYDYAAVCLCVGFFATYIGQIVLNHLMKTYQRNSYIAFSIGGVVLLSAFLMTIQSLISLAEKTSTPSAGGVCREDGT